MSKLYLGAGEVGDAPFGFTEGEQGQPGAHFAYVYRLEAPASRHHHHGRFGEQAQGDRDEVVELGGAQYPRPGRPCRCRQ